MKKILSPIQRFERDLQENKIVFDPVQKQAVEALQVVFDDLLDSWQDKSGFAHRIRSLIYPAKRNLIKGLYLWGGVGRGKTYVMDVFFQCLPTQRKWRTHFHRFMQLVHHRLHQHKGAVDPLIIVADSIATEVDVICFDEFFVSDIGDAMILANLLEALFKSGVTLVATSNIPPQGLYENGLQREKFLPAIELIAHHTRVFEVDGAHDYRLRNLEKAEIFHSPLGESSDLAMSGCFQQMAFGLTLEKKACIEVLGRQIKVVSWAEGLAWFNCEDLCGGPRSAGDYIELAQLFHTILLSNVPHFDGSNDDSARRFISLIDEMYDRKVKMIISAATSLDLLYQGEELAFPFERTRSRLIEMQSHDYLASAHMP